MGYAHAVITGASSGFGEAFARHLAGHCGHLVLVARRVEALEALAAELRAAYPSLRVTVRPCDLADEPARLVLGEQLAALPTGSLLLVNNAGLGDYGAFDSSRPERNRELLQVNICAPVELTRALLPRLAEQGGAVVNIASLAADVFIPDFALYAASKAFVASWSEALRLELREAGVRVLTVCPGPVHTGFGDVARRSGTRGGEYPLKEWFYTPIETVVAGSLAALERGSARFYPARRVRAVAWLLRNLPLGLLRAVMGRRPRRNWEVGA